MEAKTQTLTQLRRSACKLACSMLIMRVTDPSWSEERSEVSRAARDGGGRLLAGDGTWATLTAWGGSILIKKKRKFSSWWRPL